MAIIEDLTINDRFSIIIYASDIFLGEKRLWCGHLLECWRYGTRCFEWVLQKPLETNLFENVGLRYTLPQVSDGFFRNRLI